MSFLHPSSTVRVLCLRPCLLSSLLHGRKWGPAPWPTSADRQLLPVQGPRGAWQHPPVRDWSSVPPRQVSGWERRRVESGREVRFRQGAGLPIPLPGTPNPPPGTPLLNISQPLLLCHHLLLLSLHVAHEGPHDVALLVCMGL